jgi:glyoxylase-like metal-dependent hydrolase (beta-lactamase superfamily II)
MFTVMQMATLPVGPFEVNCVILWDDPAQAWIVDPGAEAPVILAALERRGLRPGLVVCTHGHIDHISALNVLLQVHAVPVYIHENDAQWAFGASNCLPPDYAEQARRPATLQMLQNGGAALAAGGIKARAIATPGHTPGGICLDLEGAQLLLTGDTLFAGSVGRTDFPGGDSRQLARSLARLLEWPDATRVIPGHGPETTIGEERRGNPYLRRVAAARPL